jgi:hypothetical protein
MPIKLQSSSGGSVTLDVPVTASNFNVTVPNASGTAMVSGNMPAFLAYKTSNQSISASTKTKVTFDTEAFDTNSNFASSTFTPTIAGYYQFNTSLSIATPSTTSYAQPYLYKNGTMYLAGTESQIFSSSYAGAGFSGLVYCNGSTDYIEIYVELGINGALYGQALPAYTFFSASLVRAA